MLAPQPPEDAELFSKILPAPHTGHGPLLPGGGRGGEMKFIKGARNWRSILGPQAFCWPLPPPPPPRERENSTLRRGLPWHPSSLGHTLVSGVGDM